MLDATVGFFLENTPSLRSVLMVGPPGFSWALACLGLAGWLKRRHGWRTGYTRKVFHLTMQWVPTALATVML